MIQFIGFLIALNSIIITAWWISTSHGYRGASVVLCLITVFFGIFLIIKDRATEITIKGVGTIKAASEQVMLDAKYIKDIKERIEAQSATVELVAKHANEAKKLSEEAKILSEEAKKISQDLEQKNDEAEKRLQDIDEAVKKVNVIMSELQSLSEFTSTVVLAQNNDRKAFDKLNVWAKDKSYPYSTKAQQASNAIVDGHNQPFSMSNFKIPWQEGADPSKFTLKDLEKIYYSAPVNIRPALIEYISKREDIGKKERMQFLIDIIQKDDNLIPVEYAGRYFAKAVGLKIKPLAIEYFINWWGENKDKIN